MAIINASIGPSSDIGTFDFQPTEEGRSRIAGFRIDGVDVYLATHEAEKDAGIVSTANLLIGVLVGLRDAAVQRMRDEKAAHDAAWAAALNGDDDAPLARLSDPGDHYVGMPR